MKKRLALIGLLLIGTTPAVAEPEAFLGLTYNFGGSVGIAVKALSNNVENEFVLAGGVAYYPFSDYIGLDVGAGYLFEEGAATLGWDLISSTPQIGVGYVNTKKD